jgi:cytochrome c peroxidase
VRGRAWPRDRPRSHVLGELAQQRQSPSDDQCDAGPLAGQTFFTFDPGRALITGQCEDIGRVKVPSRRGLAARAPYFHNGLAADVEAVIDLY